MPVAPQVVEPMEDEPGCTASTRKGRCGREVVPGKTLCPFHFERSVTLTQVFSGSYTIQPPRLRDPEDGPVFLEWVTSRILVGEMPSRVGVDLTQVVKAFAEQWIALRAAKLLKSEVE